jgi:16S rRNA (cytosine967-C5)-methyltransferase
VKRGERGLWSRQLTGAARQTPRAGTARRLAYEVLSQYDARTAAVGDAPRSGPHLTRMFEERCAAVAPSPQDRRLAMELVYGCVRRRETLDALLAAFVARPSTEVEAGLWRLLRLGAYQLALLAFIPPHAAVSETVLLARQLHKPQWTGFVNGVLRNLARALTDESEDLPSPRGILCVEPVPWAHSSQDRGETGACGWPLGALDRPRYRRLDRDVFPDPAHDPAGYLTSAGSFPRWLVDRWLARHGLVESLRLAAWFNGSGRMSLRVNCLRTDLSRVLEVLEACGIAAAPGASSACIRLGQTVRVEDLPGFAEGWFSVQDESAQEAALLLEPQSGERILDLCAAPGGKTTHLAELMGDSGRVVAADVDAERLERVEQSCRRLGLTSVETRLIPDLRREAAPAVGEVLGGGPFDAALVDVPCSNTGVLGKRPDARWRIRPEDLHELPQLQGRLLRAALGLVRPGGRVVYSTCSIEPEENSDVLRTVLDEETQWSLVQERSAVPGRPGDGGYLALLKRSA